MQTNPAEMCSTSQNIVKILNLKTNSFNNC